MYAWLDLGSSSSCPLHVGPISMRVTIADQDNGPVFIRGEKNAAKAEELEGRAVEVEQAPAERAAKRLKSGEMAGEVKEALAKIEKSGFNLEHLSDDMKNNEKVVMAAVMKDGNALRYASKEMKNNAQVVMAAVKHGGSLIGNVSEEFLQSNEEVIMAALQRDAMGFLMWAPKWIQDDKRFVMAAVKECRVALFFASERLKNDEEVIAAAGKEWHEKKRKEGMLFD